MQGIFSGKLLVVNTVLLLVLKFGAGPLVSSTASLLAIDQAFPASEIIQQTNKARITASLTPLVESAVLDRAAAQKLDDMLRNQYFAHVSPSGVSPWHWFVANNYEYSYAGENLAMGYPDATATVTAWLNSPSHKKNALNSQFVEIGVATAYATIQGDSGTVVVQLFGTPLHEVPAPTPPPVGVGLSQSSAQESPTPTPARTEPTKLSQALPVDGQTSPVMQSEPKTSSIQRTSLTYRVIETLNRTFNIYAYLLALLALGFILFRELRKELVLKTALHMLIFFGAIVLPIVTTHIIGKIQ